MKLAYISLFIFVFNLLIFYQFKRLSRYFSFKDRPDSKLKKHSHPVSLSGGLILLLNLYLIIFAYEIFDLEYFFNEKFIFPLLILITSFYLIGLVDDIKNLTPGLKLFLICISSGCVLYFFPDIKLEIIKVSFLDKNYYYFQN